MQFECGLHLAEERFKNFMAGYNYTKNTSNKKLEIGVLFSGGLDSSVLLDVVNKYRKVFNYTVTVLYVSFSQFEKFENADNIVLKKAKEYNNKIRMEICSSEKNYPGLKEATRKAMNDVAFKTEELDLVLTAHHFDDQLETVLLRLFTGSTVEQLQGMEYVTEVTRNGKTIPFGKPFIEIPRSVLIDYTRCFHIDFIEDDLGNYGTETSDRAYIRNNVLPWVEHRFNSVSIQKTLSNIKKSVQDFNGGKSKPDVNDFINIDNPEACSVSQPDRRLHLYNTHEKQ